MILDRDAVIRQAARDGLFVPRLNVDQKNILRRRKAQFGLESFHDRTQTGLEFITFGVMDASALDKQSQKIIIVELFVPAVEIALARELVWPRRFEPAEGAARVLRGTSPHRARQGDT